MLFFFHRMQEIGEFGRKARLIAIANDSYLEGERDSRQAENERWQCDADCQRGTLVHYAAMIRRRSLLFAMASALPLAAAGANRVAIIRKPEISVRPGIEVLVSGHLKSLHGKRIGLVTNQTGVNRRGVHDIDLLRAAGVKLVALFGPEHGLRGEAQAGEKVDSGIDKLSGLPVHSLYGATKQPTPEMLSGIDVLLFDMQDVGARFYTYPSTLLFVLRAAEKAGIEVMVLDRPNPLGGELIEGPVLEPRYASFVGAFALPVVHGMTMGELATMFVKLEKLRVKLTIIPMKGWRRDIGPSTPVDIPWIAPSPNMPTRATALVYPGTALFEGTNISEGRGTDQPFEQIGAPFIESAKLAMELMRAQIPGAHIVPSSFTPASSKFAGRKCEGVRLLVTDDTLFRPFAAGLTMVKAVHDLYPGTFEFRSGAPSYFDQLVGVGWVREWIMAGKSVAEMETKWQIALDAFKKIRPAFLLY